VITCVAEDAADHYQGREDERAERGCPCRVPGRVVPVPTGFYGCLSARADALFELAGALLCTDGPVKTLADLASAPEHRRGHGALYDGLNCGRIEVARFRKALSVLPLPRAADGRIVLAVDASPWLRSDAPTSAERLFCHVYGRAKSASRFIPGRPYSFVAALESGRTSWTAVLDAIRPVPEDDATAVTATQLREVVQRLLEAGQWSPGDADTLGLAGSPGRTTDPGRDTDPAPGRTPGRQWRAQAGVVMVLAHRPDCGPGRPALAGVPPQIRS
jgi:hypothetical protein